MENALFLGVSKQLLLALTSGLCILLAFGLFVRSIRKGRLPYLWAWVVRFGICGVAVASQFAGGATYSLALAGSQVVVCVAIIAMILRLQPRLGKLDGMDWFACAAAAGGVGVWLVSGNPLYGVLGVMTADAGATLMGIRAAFLKGTQESAAFWACSFTAGAAAALSAGGWSLVILLAPLFSCVNAIVNIATITYIRRRQRRPALVEQGAAA